MIVELLINLVTVVIKLLAVPFNILPDTPEALKIGVDYLFNTIFSHLDFISFFVNVSTLKAVAVIAIVIWTIDNSYSFLVWIIHKLPLSID